MPALSEDDDLGVLFARLAAAAPHAAVLDAPGSAPLSRSDCAALARARAAEVARWGLARGDLLAWAVSDRAATAAATIVLPAAATLAPLPADAPGASTGPLLARLRPKALAVDAGASAAWRIAAERLGIAIVEVGLAPDAPAGAFDWRLAQATASLDRAPTLAPSVAYVCTTSGTTGRPKLVPLSHRQVAWTSLAVAARLAVGPADRSVVLTPLHLANGMRTALLMPAIAGATVEILGEADVGALDVGLRAGRVTFVSTAFTILRDFVARIRHTVRYPSLRFLRAASGALGAGEIGRLESTFGVPVVAGLATTETGVITQQRLPPAPRIAGALGTPLGCEIRLLDESGDEVAPGEVGEVHVRGPQVFAGYLDDPALDALVLADGWYRPGDLARFGDGGELRLVGRTREMINRGGDKIARVEIDDALRELPGVVDAAGFGVAHATLGEEVGAAVVVGPGATFDADDALARLRVRLGARRAPKRVWRVDALPRTASGKLRRGELAERYGLPAAAGLGDDATPLAAALAALWAYVFGLDAWPAGASFASQGGDAARALALTDAARALFGAALDPDWRPGADATPEAMARALERALAPGRGARDDV